MTTLTPVTTRDGRVPTGKSKAGRAVRSNDDVVQYFVDALLEREPRGYLAVNSMIVQRDKIYSYGSHFCLAEIVRRESGVPRLVLTNADTWSGGSRSATGSTAYHQRCVRSAIALINEQLPKSKRFEVLEIPFSAIDAAGIDRASIKPVEIRPSRRTYHEITSPTCPGERLYVRGADGAEPDGLKYKTAAEIADEGLTPDPNVSTVEYGKSGMQHAHATGYAELREDGLWHWTVERHWMGDSLIRGKSTELRQRKANADEREAFEWFMKMAGEAEKARDAYHKSYRNEPYPDGEHYDMNLRLQSLDLGDYLRELRDALPDGISQAGGKPIVSFTLHRSALYLSSFDYNEPHRPYFLCELPYGSGAITVDEGVDSLKPPEVRVAENIGLKVLRQGDIFAIEIDGDITDRLESMAALTTVTRYETVEGPPYSVPHESKVWLRRPRANETYEPGELNIFDTNHRATRMVKTTDGKWFGRGTLYHAPVGRAPDHRQVKLGDTWHQFVKNTVPQTKGRANRTTGRFNQSGISRAWTMSGAVD